MPASLQRGYYLILGSYFVDVIKAHYCMPLVPTNLRAEFYPVTKRQEPGNQQQTACLPSCYCRDQYLLATAAASLP